MSLPKSGASSRLREKTRRGTFVALIFSWFSILMNSKVRSFNFYNLLIVMETRLPTKRSKNVIESDGYIN